MKLPNILKTAVVDGLHALILTNIPYQSVVENKSTRFYSVKRNNTTSNEDSDDVSEEEVTNTVFDEIYLKQIVVFLQYVIQYR